MEITVQKNDFAVRKVRFMQTAASQKKEGVYPHVLALFYAVCGMPYSSIHGIPQFSIEKGRLKIGNRNCCYFTRLQLSYGKESENPCPRRHGR